MEEKEGEPIQRKGAGISKRDVPTYWEKVLIEFNGTLTA